MALNYFGLLACVQAALPHLKETRGRIVGVSSMGGVIGLPGTSTYNAAKHGMRGFLRSLRVELRETGISVTVVYLGAVRTENYLRSLGEKAHDVPSVSTEEAAASIIEAGAKRRRDVIPSPEGKLVSFLYPIMPGLLDAQLARQVGRLYGE
jgi:short-subunit dehydrogenase